ncbi:MAG: RNA polymerase sigma factor [Clostridia bacterium]|nr:RNA polymerase sigma factor [Clostridia bacterium]
MDDQKIVDLYWERSESAIKETQKKYGRYCHSIAYAILHSNEDAEECVNDTYLRAWGAIPPAKPSRLATFLGKITRNLALDRYDSAHAQKRHTATELVLDELSECIPDADSTLDLTDKIALGDAINSFLEGLPVKTRQIFMRRYWYLSSIKDIARDVDMSESAVKVSLMRTRNIFKAHLEKEGIVL